MHALYIETDSQPAQSHHTQSYTQRAFAAAAPLHRCRPAHTAWNTPTTNSLCTAAYTTRCQRHPCVATCAKRSRLHGDTSTPSNTSPPVALPRKSSARRRATPDREACARPRVCTLPLDTHCWSDSTTPDIRGAAGADSRPTRPPTRPAPAVVRGTPGNRQQSDRRPFR